MQPRFPLYIPTKGRWKHAQRLTTRVLDRMNVDHTLIVEAHEYEHYARATHGTTARLLVLDERFKHAYDTCDTLGLTKSPGPGPARNFAWQHSMEAGHPWHWVMDDNIRRFVHLNHNTKHPFGDGSIFHAMETFTLRYRNVGMAGPNYSGFAKRKQKLPPFITNTRIYSCNLIRNDLWHSGYRWRGRYNEDTILSLDLLKAGWCTVQFNAFLQDKIRTQTISGGNTAEFYAREGTAPKSRMLIEQHPDVARGIWRFGREHHFVDYGVFKHRRLKRVDPADAPDEPTYEFAVVPRPPERQQRPTTTRKATR